MIIFKGGCPGWIEFDERRTETGKADKQQLVRNCRSDFKIERTHLQLNAIWLLSGFNSE